jgi:circadian clock protein KaiC
MQPCLCFANRSRNAKLYLVPTKVQPTYIEGFDEIVGGGVPLGSIMLVSGPPGTGKTIFTTQWLAAGYRHAQEPGLYISFSESISKVRANLAGLKFFDRSSMHPQRINLIDGHELLVELGLADKSVLSVEEAEQVLTVVMNLVDQTQAKRVVIDSITGLTYKLANVDAVRNFIFRLGYILSDQEATIMLVGEAGAAPNPRFLAEEFISDGIIYLSTKRGGNQALRYLEVRKLRGTNYRTGPVFFDITDDGIVIYQKIPAYNITARTDFADRRRTGISKLDELIGGGLPKGHVMLVAGNTGAGKSTLAMQFLEEGVQTGEKCVLITLEESLTQIIKTALEHDWLFDAHIKAGQLFHATADLIDVYPDKLLYEIVRLVERTGAKRLVVDSISSMESSTFSRDQTREFLLQLVAFLKSRGVNCLLTYLASEMFSAQGEHLLGQATSTDLRLSSAVDGIIILRYVEQGGEVKKALNILKLRGSEHDKRIFAFTIGRGGLVIGEPFDSLPGIHDGRE